MVTGLLVVELTLLKCHKRCRQRLVVYPGANVKLLFIVEKSWHFQNIYICNGLLGGAPKSLLAQLSGVMRAAARLILVLPRQSHVTSEIRTRLHWLDMPLRVQFKLCCLAFQCLHGSAPPYLAGYFTPVSSIDGRSQLRSAAARLLLIRRTWTQGRHLRGLGGPSPPQGKRKKERKKEKREKERRKKKEGNYK